MLGVGEVAGAENTAVTNVKVVCMKGGSETQQAGGELLGAAVGTDLARWQREADLCQTAEPETAVSNHSGDSS